MVTRVEFSAPAIKIHQVLNKLPVGGAPGSSGVLYATVQWSDFKSEFVTMSDELTAYNSSAAVYVQKSGMWTVELTKTASSRCSVVDVTAMWTYCGGSEQISAGPQLHIDLAPPTGVLFTLNTDTTKKLTLSDGGNGHA